MQNGLFQNQFYLYVVAPGVLYRYKLTFDQALKQVVVDVDGTLTD